jgi:hypothetical protein
MLPIWFIYIAAGMRIAGGLAYLVSTIKGIARPNPVSWLLWGVIPVIAFIAELQASVGLIAYVTLALGVSPILVFAATMMKNPHSFKLKGFNLICTIIAAIGILLWATTHNPEFAIGFMILADFASGLPTVAKAWRDPKSEYAPTYLISASAMVLALLTVTDWRFAVIAFPVYILSINLLIFSIASCRPAKKRRRHS